MLKKLALVAILLVVLFANSNFAQETFTNPIAKVSITLPAGWQYENTETTMMAYPKEGGFFVYFNVLHVDALDAALEEADKMMVKQVKNLKLGEVTKSEAHGMKASFVEGTADGAQVIFGVIDAPAENISIMVSSMGSPEIIKKYTSDILSIFASILPANSTQETTTNQGVNYSKIKEGMSYDIDDSKANVAVPENWSSEDIGQGNLAFSANREVFVEFIVLPFDNLDKALGEAKTKLSAKIKNLKIGAPQTTKINNMPAITVSGTGDGVEVCFAIIDSPAPNTSLFVGSWSAPALMKKFEAEVAFVINNVKPSKK